MEDILKSLPSSVLREIEKNPEILKKLYSDMVKPSLYQSGSSSEATAEDNRRTALLVLDYVFKALAYPREIMADTKTGHIYFKATDGTILGKTSELETRLDKLFGDGGGSSGNNIAVDIPDMDGKTIGAALAELIGLINGAPVKYNVQVATTAQVDILSGLKTIDGYTLKVGDRILVKDQEDKSRNGIYTVPSASAPWLRPKEFDSIADVAKGCTVLVENGTLNNCAQFTLLPFNHSSQVYIFKRLNRFLEIENPNDENVSLVLDPVNETLSLKARVNNDDVFTRVVVTKEGIIKEGFRYYLATLATGDTQITPASFDTEQMMVIETTNKRIVGSSDGITFIGGGVI